jgi:pimeloyl-ACP methyl ester carboxylesterase
MPVAHKPFEFTGRSDVRQRMQQLMGPLPGGERACTLDVREEERQFHFGLVYRRLTFSPEPGDRATGWLISLPDLPVGAPGMLCLHQTTRHGKDEPAGLAGLPNLCYGKELALRGYLCFAPDVPTLQGQFQGYVFDWVGRGYVSNTMKVLWNHMRAFEVLVEAGADPRRVGVIGHSLGGHNAIFLAAMDDRIALAATSCGFNSFHFYGPLSGWDSDRYMPTIRTWFGLDPAKLPVDFDDMLAAIAPRPLYINAPLHDDNFHWTGVDYCVERVGRLYETAGSLSASLVPAGRIMLEKPEAFHDFPEPQRKTCYDFIDRYLKH